MQNQARKLTPRGACGFRLRLNSAIILFLIAPCLFARAAHAQAPAAPTGLTATVNGSSVLLAWNPVANELAYNLRRATSPTGPYSYIMMSGQIEPAPDGTIDFTDTTAQVNTTYYYEASAINAVGEGPSCQPVSAMIISLACAPGD